MRYAGDIAQGLTDELLQVIHKYDETMLVSTVIGVLEVIKNQLIADALIDLGEDDEEDE